MRGYKHSAPNGAKTYGTAAVRCLLIVWLGISTREKASYSGEQVASARSKELVSEKILNLMFVEFLRVL